MVIVVTALVATIVGLAIVVVVLGRALMEARSRNFDLRVMNRKIRGERSSFYDR